jgi:hypothetical protein
MVFWCKSCGALMGVREPYHDWKVDRNSLCRLCAPIDIVMQAREMDTETGDTDVNHETIFAPSLSE